MSRRGSRGDRRRSGPRRLVVIGASMGGVPALRALFAELPPGLDAAFVVVLHRSTGVTVLPEIIARESGHAAEEARDGRLLEAGGVYVAPAGRHTRVEGGRLSVAMGPRENGHRPSINVLFRAAAESFGARAIGVVLSGARDCGATGLAELKRRGGIAVVQDPRSALNPQMPSSAMAAVTPDHVLAPAEMGPLLARLVAEPVRRKRGTAQKSRAKRSTSGARLDSALWEALKVMQERVELSRRMARKARASGQVEVAAELESRAGDAAENAALLSTLVHERKVRRRR